MSLSVDRIDVYRGDSQVLSGVSLEVRQGEALALLGRNGAGKTTTLRAIMGMLPPAQGRVLLNGTPVTGQPPHRLALAGVAYLPETRGVLPSFTVVEALRLAGHRRPGQWTVERIWELFPRLAERMNHRGDQLSGGEQQMLGIATALLLNPVVLLLDEPTHGLAPLLVQEVRDRIAAIVREGLAVVLVEQNFRVATALATRAVVLGKGRVRWSGAMTELSKDRDVQTTWLGV